jgi:hypothetical protein
VALAPLKKPKAPAWKTYKPARPNYAPPKRFTSGAAPPQGYAKYGIGTPAPWGQTAAAAQPKQPQYKMFDWSTIAGGGDFSGQAFQQPDYGAMIGGDWEVQDAEAAMGAQMARMRGDFQAGLRSQLIDLGLTDTSKLGSLGQYIDQDTIKKAVENKYSATAQIGQQAERARAGNNAALAARGLLSSGQTTKSEQDVSAAAESGRYSALRSFLESGASGLSGIADAEYNLARGVAQARQAAAMRAAELAQWNSQFDDRGGEAGAGGTLFAPNASAGLGNIPLNLGFNPNYVRPQMMGRNQFLAKKPQGNYQTYRRAWQRQHPLGF